jgi:phage regulator Rha-like protein
MSISDSIKQIDNIPSSKTSLSLIIHGGNNQICVDSRDIAKEFGRQHKNVLQTLDDLLKDGTISQLESKPRIYQKLGREYRRYELNKAGFLKAMPFIGGRKSREGQRRFVDAFLKMEAALDRQSKERASLAYQVARLSGKDSRGILTDVIKEFVVYAKELGSSNADRYFSSITKLVQKPIDIPAPQVTEARELMTAIQLSNLSTIELTAAQALSEGMEAKLPYKDIYQAMKNALDGFVSSRLKILDS